MLGTQMGNARPNNSAEAVAHLLNETKASRVIVSSPYAKTLRSAIASISDTTSIKTILQPEPSIYKLPHIEPIEPWTYPLIPSEEKDLPFVMIHSSGSTGFPKVNPYT